LIANNGKANPSLYLKDGITLLKADLTLFIKRLRKLFKQLDYVWIFEFPTRGAPHFHFFSNLEPTPENHDILTSACYDIAG
jgi:hypothetical protein